MVLMLIGILWQFMMNLIWARRYNIKIKNDPYFKIHIDENPKTSKFLYIISAFWCYHSFRFQFSKTFGSPYFNAKFKDDELGFRYIHKLTVPTMAVTFLFVIIACSYNLAWI
jgi:hypothetical protein